MMQLAARTWQAGALVFVAIISRTPTFVQDALLGPEEEFEYKGTTTP